MSTTDFMGRDGFIWFTGVVEDRKDPLKLGRVRVRCLGYHTEDKNIFPTSDLPWAHPLLPITSSGVSGIGQTPLGLVEGSWVVGFFRDADTKQDAVIMGSLPGKPTTTGAQNLAEGLGFSDPNGIFPRHAENDVNRLARNDADNQSITLEARKTFRNTYLGIPTANTIEVKNGVDIAPSEGDVWSLPENTYATEYPYGHVYESESGHILEFDDTPNKERILLYHHSGTETEITAEGTKNEVNKDSTHTITEKDSKVFIKGNSDITINGRHKIMLNADGAAGNNYDIQVGGGANVNIQVSQGNINMAALDGDINMFANNNMNIRAGGTLNILAGKIVEDSQSTTTRTAQSEYHTYGDPIDHN
tara:strand:- start:28 stop:1110 length:1083 start_codon:yes stop_codon:yes gene_type:complete